MLFTGVVIPCTSPPMNAVRCLALLAVLALLSACANTSSRGEEDRAAEADTLGRSDAGRDRFLAQFNQKTDVDDLHSVARGATMLADPRFSEVRYHAVAGAYGMQEGLYVPADVVFDRAFGTRWSDAHGDVDAAGRRCSTSS